ncbi:MAG: hypothetical protein FWC68_03175 [Oscillospiraceae bacterium]|nr:hypothetical protein [Oscillospiraceae bacterium]
MRKLRIVLISLLAILGVMALWNVNETYATETRTLNIQRQRPYVVPNTRHQLNATGSGTAQFYHIVKIFDVSEPTTRC